MERRDLTATQFRCVASCLDELAHSGRSSYRQSNATSTPATSYSTPQSPDGNAGGGSKRRASSNNCTNTPFTEAEITRAIRAALRIPCSRATDLHTIATQPPVNISSPDLISPIEPEQQSDSPPTPDLTYALAKTQSNPLVPYCTCTSPFPDFNDTQEARWPSGDNESFTGPLDTLEGQRLAAYDLAVRASRAQDPYQRRRRSVAWMHERQALFESEQVNYKVSLGEKFLKKARKAVRRASMVVQERRVSVVGAASPIGAISSEPTSSSSEIAEMAVEKTTTGRRASFVSCMRRFKARSSVGGSNAGVVDLPGETVTERPAEEAAADAETDEDDECIDGEDLQLKRSRTMAYEQQRRQRRRSRASTSVNFNFSGLFRVQTSSETASGSVKRARARSSVDPKEILEE